MSPIGCSFLNAEPIGQELKERCHKLVVAFSATQNLRWGLVEAYHKLIIAFSTQNLGLELKERWHQLMYRTGCILIEIGDWKQVLWYTDRPTFTVLTGCATSELDLVFLVDTANGVSADDFSKTKVRSRHYMNWKIFHWHQSTEKTE